MKIREFIAKYDRIFILVLIGVACVIVLVTTLAVSQREQSQWLGTILDRDLVGSQNHRLFARQNGGFFLVSEEEERPVVTQLGPSGTVGQTFGGDPDTDRSCNLSYPAFQRGGLLFVTDFFVQDEQSLDAWYALMVLDLEGEEEHPTAYWKVSSEEVDFIHEPISLTADSKETFYFVNPSQFGILCSFQAEDLEDGNLMQHQEFSLGDRYLSQIISTPDDGLYVLGQDWTGDDVRYAVWWMDPYATEDTLIEVEAGESFESLVFPVDFVNKYLAVCNDGKLYRVEEDHTFTKLNWEVAENGLEMVVSQTGGGTILVKSPDNKVKEYQLQNPSQPGRVVFDGQTGEILTFASNADDTMILLEYPDVGYSLVRLSEVNVPGEGEPSSTQTSLPTQSNSSDSSNLTNPSSSEILSEPAGGDSEASSGNSSNPSSGNPSVPSGSSSSPSSAQPPVSSGGQEDTPKEIASDTFMKIDSEYLVVDPDTTWAKLRDTIPVGGGRLEYQRANGTKHPGGKVGTGTHILLYDQQGELIDRVTVVVPGDVNGSATVNTRDESIMYQYLLDQEDLTGAYWHAADYNHDDIVDVLDLVYLKRFIA